MYLPFGLKGIEMTSTTSSREQREQWVRYILMGITAIAYVIAWISFSVPFVKILPLFVSLFVMMLQAKVSRFGYLLGGVNSVLYAIIYIITGIYASAASALLFSFPIQIVTFLRWRKNSYEKSTILRRMSAKGRILSLLLFLVAWGVTLGVLMLSGSDFAILDTSVSLLGILVSVLVMLAYIEYAPLWLLSSILSLALNIQVTMSDITFLPYTISAVYNLLCTIYAFYNVTKLYRIQNSQKGEII